jgi:hypothetical protein
MARGFESKAVADQQESAQSRRVRPEEPGAGADPALLTRRRQLELARADIERRLALATAPAHRQMLERAHKALTDDIAALGQ